MVSKRYLIFTDLDGTLINHQSYSLGVNDKIIKKLTQNSHQVIINSSKTFTEIKKLVSKLYLSNMPTWRRVDSAASHVLEEINSAVLSDQKDK